MLAVKLHRVRRLAHFKSMHWQEGGSNWEQNCALTEANGNWTDEREMICFDCFCSLIDFEKALVGLPPDFLSSLLALANLGHPSSF
jgi:hypothetical protein